MTETATGLIALAAFFLMPFLTLHWYGSSGEPTWVERLVHLRTTRRHRRTQRLTRSQRQLSKLIEMC